MRVLPTRRNRSRGGSTAELGWAAVAAVPVLVMTGLFAALADLHPDPSGRLRILRETEVVADRFAMPNSHAVPIVDLAARTLLHRSIQLGDRFNLFE